MQLTSEKNTFSPDAHNARGASMHIVSQALQTNWSSHHTISVISDPTIKHIRCFKTAIMSQVYILLENNRPWDT